MTDLADFTRIAGREQGLVVVSTARSGGGISSSVVNAGVLEAPTPVVGFVVRGNARKLVHLRADPRATVVARSGWEWAAVEGTVTLIGPADPGPDGPVDPESLRLLLRGIFTAAGGTHDDWPTFDQVMATEHRTAVLLTPHRAYSA